MITTHLSESGYDGATNPPLRLLDDLAIATATSSPNKIGIEEGNAVLNNVDDEGLPESLDLTDDANASLTITTTNQPREHRACAYPTTTTDNQPREHIVTSPGMGGFRGYHASGLDVEVSYWPFTFVSQYQYPDESNTQTSCPNHISIEEEHRQHN